MRILLTALLFGASTAWAVDPATHLTQYSHRAWRLQDGLFDGAPTAIAQTTDGYLWIGTANGLFRFDGVSFVSWADMAPEKQLGSAEISALLGARDGRHGKGRRGSQQGTAAKHDLLAIGGGLARA